MSIKPSDVLFYGAGASLKKYGTLSRHTTVIARRGEDVEETFTRTGAAATWAGDGTLVSAAANLPRINHWDDGAILSTPRTVLEGAGTNLCTYADDLSNWTSTGTPTTTDTAVSIGDLDLCLIGDDDGAGTEYKRTTAAYTGDAVKGVCAYVKEGASPSARSTIALWDATGTAFRLEMDLVFTSGVPAVTEDVGTLVDTTLLANGIYRLDFQTTAVTAANTNELRVYPANANDADTGDIYVGGVQTENQAFCSSRILTSAGTATRNAETLSFPFWAPPQLQTVYSKSVERGTVLTASGMIWHIGSSTDSAQPRLQVFEAAGEYQVQHVQSTTVTSKLTAAPSVGDVVELRCVLNADGSVQIHQSINGAAETSATASGALALASAWVGTSLYIGSRAGSNIGFNEHEALIATRGSHSLADFRALLP